MNPGNDGRNDNDPGNTAADGIGRQPPKRMSEQAAIFNTFALIIRNKFSSEGEPEAATNEVPSDDMTDNRRNPKRLEHRLKKLDEAYKSPLYQVEKAILQELNNNGFGKGLMCGVGTFLFLRSGPRLLRRYIAKNSKPITAHPVRNGNSGDVGGYTFDKTSGGMGTPPTNGMHNSTAEMIPQPGLFFRTIKFGLDVVGSLYMALFASAYFTDKKKLLNDMSQIPLVEGKSLLSDELCDDFIDVYRGIPKRTWEKYEVSELNGEGDGVEALTAIGNFVKNCLKRQAKEKEILEEHRAFGMMGMEADAESESRKDQHPAIPSPGVSPDTPFVIEWGDNSDDVSVGKERHRDDFDLDDFGEVGFDDLFGDESSSFSAYENPDEEKK